ncbi:beta-N-acetylhexosaminidase [Butyrivibrio proteoclasticus]|uniref:beta-N-acetylhexosaminidase n=1 Tax=Butyrivibrio proteoclasticus TaxID=43305 RepID=A0A1I5VF49_9FIRM|nr:glycoside hydrolase family 3 N-terminal domain-containing protein [Butyrivibrio proteoclasticus]SFQ06178.1 beta-N-acetylhexosaminidase [Butyrivibrio proteoclasticus]
MVDLTQKPFYLNENQIRWVTDTINEMTIKEKLGQLFVLLKAEPGINEERIKKTLAEYNQGGHRWQGGSKTDAYKLNKLFQENSKYPLFIAANCDDGGIGVAPEGTFVATAAECGAGEGVENAYHLGYVSGREASAVGCNWMFNPVVDIYMNWRNTIVNTRSFGQDPEKVLENARAYIKGVKDANPNMACTAKHFPGDGVEELDQHLAMGVNSLSVSEWEKSFGYVYRTLIDEGLETIMVGHIALPEMTRKLCPGIEDKDIKPATLAKELLTDLLRDDMGFNGLVVTDATHMIGFAATSKRSDALPSAIMAGCDMILFANDIEEDISFLRNAYEDGRLTEERLHDALMRILGMKAHLGMDSEKRNYPSEDMIDIVGCSEHKKYAVQAADECITLVKDTRGYLPLDLSTGNRVFLVYVGSSPTTLGYKKDPVKQMIIDELTEAGFEVDVCPNYFELELDNGITPMNFIKMLNHEKREKFISQHDLALIVINVKGYAQENNVRVRWSINHSCELPWYNEEIPTIAVSLNYTNHLIDLPQVHTFINAYGARRENIKAVIEKMLGQSSFKGKADESVFCGRWDTRL